MWYKHGGDILIRSCFESYGNIRFHREFDNLAISLLLLSLPTYVARSPTSREPYDRDLAHVGWLLLKALIPTEKHREAFDVFDSPN